jgi:hypothetical protein
VVVAGRDFKEFGNAGGLVHQCPFHADPVVVHGSAELHFQVLVPVCDGDGL